MPDPDGPAMSEPRTPLAVARAAGGHLAARGVRDGRLDAELLLASVLGVNRLELYLQHERRLTDEELDRYRGMVRRRARREPLQYITGTVTFRQLELRVDRRALIPRPETEVLVGLVLDRAREQGAGASARALDIGTGTGAIALSLLAEGGVRSCVATDVSADALALAGENAAALGLADRLELRAGTLWQPVVAGERFDVIVSNPPYIATPEGAGLDPEVVDWEPGVALFAGADGLAVVEPIVRGAPDRLAERGLLALEIGETQSQRVAQLARSVGLVEVRIHEDLAGRPRIVTAVLA